MEGHVGEAGGGFHLAHFFAHLNDSPGEHLASAQAFGLEGAEAARAEHQRGVDIGRRVVADADAARDAGGGAFLHGVVAVAVWAVERECGGRFGLVGEEFRADEPSAGGDAGENGEHDGQVERLARIHRAACRV